MSLTVRDDAELQSGTSPSAREFQLGVLLVHGIGTPRPGDTLVHWGDLLLRTIERASHLPEAERRDRLASSPSIPAGSRGAAPERVLVSVERAALGESPPNGRFEAAVRLKAGDHTERWLLREGLWAAAFPAPSYRELLSWSVRALPWSIVTHFGVRYWQSAGRATRSWQVLKLASIALLKRPWDRAIIAMFGWAIRHLIAALAPRVEAVFLLVVALALTPVLITVLGLTLLVGLIPIPQFRTLALEVQSKLTATVGDSFAFVESPIRAALIRECILNGLKRLKPLCVHTVVVAHSQGAAVVLEALGALEPSSEKHEVAAVRRLVPDALITFGAGTNQLASQKVLADRIPKMKISPVLGAVGAIFLVAGLSLWMYSNATARQILQGGVVTLLFFMIQRLVYLGLARWGKKQRKEPGNNREDDDDPWKMWGGPRWWKEQSAKPGNNREDNDDPWKKVEPWKKKYYTIIGTALGGTWGLVTSYFSNLPMATIAWLLLTLAVLYGSISFVLSPEGKKIVQAPVSRPLGLRRWVDLYASADPVPNGRTRTIEGGHESKRIWNLGSLIRDHTTYWDNRDGFVLRVAKVCAETAESPWTNQLPDESDFVDKRAAWRVGFLRAARLISGATWLVLGVALWGRNLAKVPVPFSLPSWVPAPPVEHALFAVLIALGMWVTSSALCWIWKWWVLAEQEVVLGHEQPGQKELPVGQWVIFFMALLVFVWIATVVYVVLYIRSSADLSNLINGEALVLTVWPSLLFAWLCTYLPRVLKCRPPVRVDP